MEKVDWTTTFAREEFEGRLAGVRRRMAERGLRGFLTHTPENIYYLTGYQTAGYYTYQALIVPEAPASEPVFVIRLPERTNVLARSWLHTMVTYEDTDDPVEVTYRAMSDAGLTRGVIGVEKEAWFLTVKDFEKLAGRLGSDASIVDASGLVEGLRVVKSAAEIAYIRAAAEMANAGVRAGIEMAAVGRSEDEVAAEIHRVMVGLGSEYPSLPVMISSGPRAALTHATWEGRVLEKGDLVPIELSGCYKRYGAALFRTVYLGDQPSELIRRMDAVVMESLDAIIDAMRPGVLSDELDRLNREIRARHGFPRPLRIGYSMGISFPPGWGEGHALSLGSGETRALEPGMVFHVPVNIRLWGQAFVAASETILVTPTGREVLTSCPPRRLIVKS
jgi:Xaa-Pro dipeptidase